MVLTHPVASNIFRSSGSPESTPSILVREWQVAMQATKGERIRLSLQALSSGSWKLNGAERRRMRKAPLARAGVTYPSVEMATQTPMRGLICMAHPIPWTAWVANGVPAGTPPPPPRILLFSDLPGIFNPLDAPEVQAILRQGPGLGGRRALYAEWWPWG